MTLLRLRITGDRNACDRIIDCLKGLDQVGRVAAVGDLMPAMDDEDSSSAGLAEQTDVELCRLEVEVEGNHEDVVRRLVEIEARDAGAALEIVDRF